MFFFFISYNRNTCFARSDAQGIDNILHVTLLKLTCLSVLLGGAVFHSSVMSSYSKQSSAASPHTVSRPPKKVPWLLCPLGTSAIGPAGRSEQTLPGLARSITLISSELYGFTTTIRLEVRPFEQPEPFDTFLPALIPTPNLPSAHPFSEVSHPPQSSPLSSQEA